MGKPWRCIKLVLAGLCWVDLSIHNIIPMHKYNVPIHQKCIYIRLKYYFLVPWNTVLVLSTSSFTQGRTGICAGNRFTFTSWLLCWCQYPSWFRRDRRGGWPRGGGRPFVLCRAFMFVRLLIQVEWSIRRAFFFCRAYHPWPGARMLGGRSSELP